MSYYNVVFQGGGAKLFPLLAAVEAMQEQVVSDNSFSIGAVSGASAGSIAAMIYAADVDTKELRRHFKSKSGQSSVMSAFPSPSKYHVVKSMVLGRTIFDRTKLEDLLYTILSLAGHDKKKEKIKLHSKLKIAVTDLKKSKIEFVELSEATPEEIVRNIADSCSIPFVFKNHNSKINWEFVDGGLFENFPISSIVDHPDEGRKTLGFSFEEEGEEEVNENPAFISYVKLLVSSAIDANIEASLRLLGDENIFRIKTNISTLQFGLGLEHFVKTDSYWDSLKTNISGWIEDVVRREAQIDANIASAEKSLIPTNFSAMQSSVGKLFRSRKPDNVRIKKSVSYMQLNNFFPDSSPYRISFDFLYRKSVYDVPPDGIECLFFGTSYSSTIEVEKYSDIVVFDSAGNELDFVVLPISSTTDVLDFVCLAIFFSQRIVPDVTSEIVVVQKQYLPKDSLDLERLGHGHIEVRCAPDVRIEQTKLFIGLPKDRSTQYSAVVLDKHHEDPDFDLELLGGTPTNDAGEIIELRSAGIEIIGFELDGPLEPDKAFLLKVEKNLSLDT